MRKAGKGRRFVAHYNVCKSKVHGHTEGHYIPNTHNTIHTKTHALPIYSLRERNSSLLVVSFKKNGISIDPVGQFSVHKTTGISWPK